MVGKFSFIAFNSEKLSNASEVEISFHTKVSTHSCVGKITYTVLLGATTPSHSVPIQENGIA